MVIEINKDIERYQESVVMGLTAKQLIFSIASVIVGGGLVLLLYPYIGLTGSAYVAIPVVAPIALGGFYSYNGMSFYEVMKKRFHFMFGNRALTYVSTEGEPAIKKIQFEETLKEKKSIVKHHNKDSKVENTSDDKSDEDKKQAFEQSKKKMKRMLVVLSVLVVLFICTIYSYKAGLLTEAVSYINNLVN